MAIALHKSTDNRVIEAATTALLARMTGLPANRDLLINQTIWQLVKTGNWAEMDELVLYSTHDEATALLGWKNNFNPVKVGDPTFVADRGFTGSIGGNYIRTNWNPATAGGLFTQNSASLGVISLTDNISSNVDIGSSQGTLGITIRTYIAANNFQQLMNNTTTQSVNNGGTSKGIFSMQRTASNRLVGWANKSANGVSTTATTGVPNLEVFSCCRNVDGVAGLYSTREQGGYFFGSGNIDHYVVHQILENYCKKIGSL